MDSGQRASITRLNYYTQSNGEFLSEWGLAALRPSIDSAGTINPLPNRVRLE
jgi:hypothetical protein